ncbi:MAG: zinc-finger domain-containing protein [Burkholderiales bacterium]|nr:zinc-finger domain-containing protein [Burkholderiales bacterium]
MSATDQLPVVELEADQLPAYCPNPSMPVWCHHPRVYLDVASSGFARCPYCGTGYRLKGAAPAGH